MGKNPQADHVEGDFQDLGGKQETVEISLSLWVQQTLGSEIAGCTRGERKKLHGEITRQIRHSYAEIAKSRKCANRFLALPSRILDAT